MKKISSTIILLLLTVLSQAQQMSYSHFIRTVAEKNAAYLAEKFNVDIATAGLQAAKVFNDPELSVSYGNNQDWYMLMGKSVEAELSYDLDISGSRRARIGAAKSEKELTEASVNAYLSSLRLDAARAWAEAWRLRESCGILAASVDDMMQVAASDSLRAKLGEIPKTDATQSRIEAQTLYGELLSLQAEYSNALMTLSYLCGGEPVTGITDETLPSSGIGFAEAELYEMAEKNRSDLKAAELSQTLSENNMKIVKAARAFDMGLTLGYSYNSEVRNEIAPAPKFNGLSVGVSIPLKISSLNRGEINAARAQVEQSRKYYEDARMQVRMETAQAINSLEAAKKVLAQYDGNMISDAKEILESRKMGYLRGESSLLELLTAQQTYRDVMQGYTDARCERFIKDVEMEFAVGYLPIQ